MKKIFYIIIILISTLTISCNSWLDIEPEGEVGKDKLFTTQEGFHEALIGCYIMMKADGIYGNQMMWGAMESLAQHWDFTPESDGESYNIYDYKATIVKGSMSAIFKSLYETIGKTNSILESIDNYKTIFEPGIYEIIKAEALGIRALCHMDLLRLFGPIPTSTITNTKILPYVKSIKIPLHDYSDYKTFCSELYGDLDMAATLLRNTDPIVEGNKNDSELILDKILRNSNVNYYAILALKARFHLWNGDRAEAAKCAEEILSSKAFELSVEAAYSEECIFALNYPKLQDKVENQFNVTGKFIRDIAEIKLLYDSPADKRLQEWWEEMELKGEDKVILKNVFVKYLEKDEESEEDSKVYLPIIRLPEIYFIAIECSTKLEDATEIYKYYCSTRDINPITFTSMEQVTELLLKEYNREYYGEGQTFFQYKRLAVRDIMWTDMPGSNATYVVPLPDGELYY